ncbi:MAG: ParA family protein [Xanthobacteraceae bacterium]
MHTIALVTQKGGSGKSTLAIGLAIAAIADGHKVRLLETDPQGTVSNWRRRRTQAEPIVETVDSGFEIERKLSELAYHGLSLTIIDTAGGNGLMMQAAIGAADLCLIPARPSPADIEATAPTLAAIRALDKPFAFVLNQTPPRSYRLAHAVSALSGTAAEPSAAATDPGETATELSAMGVLALPYIVLRNDQQDALGAGLAVTEYALGGKSADEIRGLWQWVWRKLTVRSLSAGPLTAGSPASDAALYQQQVLHAAG